MKFGCWWIKDISIAHVQRWKVNIMIREKYAEIEICAREIIQGYVKSVLSLWKCCYNYFRFLYYYAPCNLYERKWFNLMVGTKILTFMVIYFNFHILT